MRPQLIKTGSDGKNIRTRAFPGRGWRTRLDALAAARNFPERRQNRRAAPVFIQTMGTTKGKPGRRRALAALVSVSALMGSCGTTPAANEGAAAAPSPDFNGVPSPPGDCWARLYEHRRLGGRVLTIAGPAGVGDLAPHRGFPWDPRYESLVVGPGALLVLFDAPGFKERKASFSAGAMVFDLDREMGVFRRTRSVKVECVDTK